MKQTTLSLAALFVLVIGVQAQSYSIDWHTMEGGGGTSTGSGYILNGAFGHPDGGMSLSGGGYTLEGGFSGIQAATASGSVAIFDNTGGTENGSNGATTTKWLAGKFCLGAEAYSLDSLTMFLTSVQTPVSVRLRIFTHDPASGRPGASTGLIMNLSSLTNPISITPGNVGISVRWVPAAPFTLVPNTCYWAVLSLESGTIIGRSSTFTRPTGAAAGYGVSVSEDAGVTWSMPDNSTNQKMLITGTAVQAVPAPQSLVITSYSLSGNDLRLSFPSTLGRSYGVESREDFTTNPWVPFPGITITGNNEVVQFSLTNALTRPQQYYRLRQLP